MKEEEIEKIRKFKEFVLGLNVVQLRDKDIMRELAILFNAIGDVMRLVRLPKETYLDKYEDGGSVRLATNKEYSKEKIKQLKGGKKKDEN